MQLLLPERFARATLATVLLLSAALGVPSVGAQEVGDELNPIEITDALPVDAAETPIEAPVATEDAGAPADPAFMVIDPAPAPAEVPATPVPTLAPTMSTTTTPAAGASSAPARPTGGKIAATVIDNRFQPVVLTVPVGGTVTWTNQGNNLHTLTSPDGLFDSGALTAGASFSYTFSTPGTYRLICRQHSLSGMAGQVVVQ